MKIKVIDYSIHRCVYLKMFQSSFGFPGRAKNIFFSVYPQQTVLYPVVTFLGVKSLGTLKMVRLKGGGSNFHSVFCATMG